MSRFFGPREVESRSSIARVLIVDDNDGTRYSLAKWLTRAGYTIQEAATGTEALACATRDGSDIILLDVQLPDVNGFEVSRELKSNPRTASIPLIQISASFVTVDDRVRGLQGGADAYLVQPFEPRELIAQIEALLRVRRAEAALRDSERRQRELSDVVNLEGQKRQEAMALVDAILEHAPVGLAFFDRAHRYVRVNEFLATKINGLPIEAHLGHSIRDVVPINANVIEPLIDQVFETGKAVSHFEVIGETPASPGLTRHWLSGFFPVRSSAGEVRFVGAVVMEISQQKDVEAELRQARDLLATANTRLEKTIQDRTARLRDLISDLEQFSYAIVHDLRAPLRAIQGFAGILDQEFGSQVPTGALAHLARIRSAAARMDHLVSDALAYSKVLREQLPLRPVALGPLLHGIVESYPNLHPPQAEVSLVSDFPTVLGNEAALTQCFSNLLGNAVKFVAPSVKAQVVVRCAPVQQEGKDGQRWVRISVQDNGIGIEADQQDKIFGIFQRLHSLAEYEGTGIGLAIVKKAVERMSGRVGVESEVGKGSCFWVELKVATSRGAST